MKKAVAKVLRYMAAVSVLSFINSILPHFIGMIIESTTISTSRTLTHYVTANYVIRVLANITAFPTPIVTIILLKPVRDAIKTMSKKVCLCCHKNRELSATIEPTTITTEEHPASDITGVSLATTKEGSNNIENNLTISDQNPTTIYYYRNRSGYYTSGY